MTQAGATWKDLKGNDPIWCPGCGDFGVLRAMQQAITDLGRTPEETVLATGIGCSGTINGAFRTYGFHGLHGRVLPAATGIKLANPDLTVIATGGDGDGFGIGLGHFMHAARRNVDLCYVVMDNQVYGLTKGQTSPTTPSTMTTKASPLGPMADAVNPLELAIVGGATFVAQGFSADQKQLADLIAKGIEHPGFAFINVQSPCVTYNLINTYAWFKDHIRHVDHDASDRAAALAVAQDQTHVPLGLLYQGNRPVFCDTKGDRISPARHPAGHIPGAMPDWMQEFRVR